MQTGLGEQQLREFLLGTGSEADAEEICVALVESADFAERLGVAEDLLIEDYVGGNLSEDERAAFLDDFMTTPARVEKLEQISLLVRFARAPAREKNADAKESGGIFASLAALVGGRSRLAVAGLAVIVVAVGAVWFFAASRARMSPLEAEYAALNAKDLTNAPEIAGISVKSLAPDVFRGAGEASKLRLDGLSERVLLRLALPVKTFDKTDAEVVSGGKVVFKQTGLRVYANPNGAEVKLVIPRSILTAGRFDVKLTDGPTFAFFVE